MKHDKLFSTHIFLIDNVIPEKDILDIRKHIISTITAILKIGKVLLTYIK